MERIFSEIESFQPNLVEFIENLVELKSMEQWIYLTERCIHLQHPHLVWYLARRDRSKKIEGWIDFNYPKWNCLIQQDPFSYLLDATYRDDKIGVILARDLLSREKDLLPKEINLRLEKYFQDISEMN